MVLHGHLPYVHHPELTEPLEEKWLFEALTECYLPLLGVFESLVKDGVYFRITLSLSPTLITMLTDPKIQERYLAHMQKSITLAKLEQQRLINDAEFQHLADFYLEKLLQYEQQFKYYNCNLLEPLKQLQEQGFLEIITTCATHGYLPLMKNMTSWRAQVETALDLYTMHFGRPSPGIWLPECAYTPGVEEVLRKNHIAYFFVDHHGIANSRPAPVYGIFAPVSTRDGVIAFGRDPDSSRQVWDRHGGYPGDPYYREFYRDIGYDLDINYLSPFLPAGNIRVDTGFKYYRITGSGPHKKPYQPGMARERAAWHAEDFVNRRRRQLELAARSMSRRPLTVAPYDAELFGHWWFEGPSWLDNLCRKTSADVSLQMITPLEYLQEYPENQIVELPMSSWGAGGYNQFWLNQSTDWVYKHLHQAEDKMSELADSHPKAGELKKRCLNQAARELLLAQSSDWTFIIHSDTAVDYAAKRLNNHIGRFNILANMLNSGKIEEKILSEIEARINFLPNIDYHIYCTNRLNKNSTHQKHKYRIMILSWEYPPRTVGGLARHVHDLSCALASSGNEVHVITCPVTGRGVYNLERGVHVHRIHSDRLTAENFMEWVRQLNDSMADMADKLVNNFGNFDLVHAHDWLVGTAAEKICNQHGLPLIATIHATEHGRNRGLYTELQRHIHSLEYKLAQQATLVIGCSRYMGQEISRLFNQPSNKIKIIPNGVEPENITAGLENSPSHIEDRDKNIVFIGRLVPEKGVQILIEALPLIQQAAGPARLIIAGKGPYKTELVNLAHRVGVAEQVDFIGFVDDQKRNRILNEAAVTVFPSLYEPFGIVALEAMAAGVPVVVSDTGGLHDVIEHGVDGYRTPPGDTYMLANYIVELINNPELAKQFTQRARRNLFVKFNWEQIASMTLKVYDRAVEKYQRKRNFSSVRYVINNN